MDSNMKIARVAGALYLFYIAANIVADLLARIGFGNPKAIVDMMVSQAFRFRTGLITGFISIALFLLTAWALYVLLRPVGRDLALLFLLLNIAGVAVQSASMLFLFGGQILLGGSNGLSALGPDQSRLLATAWAALYKDGYIVAQIFYGAWLFPLGWLVLRSGFLPRFIGVLLLADFAAVLIWFTQSLLFPTLLVVKYPCLAVSFIAEFSLGLWLVVMGAKSPGPVPHEIV